MKRRAEILDASPPHDLDAERALLGSLILKPEIMPELVALRPGDFHDPAHRKIFEHCLGIHAEGAPIDLALLFPRFKAHESELGCKAAAVMAELSRNCTSANWTFYLERVREISARRQLGNLGERLQVESANGKAPANSIEDAIAELQGIKAAPEAKLLPIPLGQLIDENPTLQPVVVDGLSRQGETANIVGGSKVGKSWLKYHLLICIALGWKFLGRFQCTRGKVLLVDNELHRSTIAHRIDTVANAMGAPMDELREQLTIWPLRGHLLNLHQVLEYLESEIEPGTLQAIGFDAFYRGYPPGVSENDNAQVMALYNAIDATAERLGCAWFNIHHSSKGSQSEKRTTDVGSGAGTQSRCVDAHIIFREHEEADAVVLDAALRSFAPIEPMCLRWQFPLWVPDDDLDPAKLKGKLTQTEQRQSARDNEGIGKLAAVHRAKARRLYACCVAAVAWARPAVSDCSIHLEASGSVKWTETMIRGNPCRIYESIDLDTDYADRNEPF